MSDVRPNIGDVRDREDTHVDALTGVIEDLDGDPVEEACYDFGYDTASEFLGVAGVLEKHGRLGVRRRDRPDRRRGAADDRRDDRHGRDTPRVAPQPAQRRLPVPRRLRRGGEPR